MFLDAIREFAYLHYGWTLVLALIMTFIWYYFFIVGMASVFKTRGYHTVPRRILCIFCWIATTVGAVGIWTLIASASLSSLLPK